MKERDITPAIRTIIADDERLARQKLRLLLQSEDALTVLADCRDGKQTVAAVRAHKPDLLFLDIRMPQLDGFQVLANIPAAAMPVVVFTTAYDQYAIKAFEANALDYLLKPFDQKRLHRAVERARAQLAKSHDQTVAGKLLSDLLARAKSPAPLSGRLLIKSAGRLVILDLNDIDWIEAAANYVKLNVGHTSYLLRESIGRVADRLDADRFARIHRSTIVNVSKLQELQPCDGGEFIAILKSGKTLSCSRGYRPQMQRLIDSLR
jgi:two-component system LytT family response regulator